MSLVKFLSCNLKSSTLNSDLCPKQLRSHMVKFRRPLFMSYLIFLMYENYGFVNCSTKYIQFFSSISQFTKVVDTFIHERL